MGGEENEVMREDSTPYYSRELFEMSNRVVHMELQLQLPPQLEG
jgi:hypothetical protein